MVAYLNAKHHVRKADLFKTVLQIGTLIEIDIFLT